jgi:RNA recognition motif-containing protein
MNELELEDLFKPYGEVSRARIPLNRETAEPRGFGFVTMPNDERAQTAISALNGSMMRGQLLRVNKSLKSR